MNQAQLESISPQQRKTVAAAYLMAKKDERPENTLGYYKKLEQFDAQASSLNEEMKRAQKFINDSRPKIQQLIGSIQAVSEIISECLPEDKIDKWCLAYELPEPTLNQVDSKLAAPQAAQPVEVDMAGATAKSLPKVDISDLSKGK